jgi:ectoine hydroxylase-related dioxygenase (phytanoyl-CoA dioxygenase family)
MPMASTIEELIAHRPADEFTVRLSSAQIDEFNARGFIRIDRLVGDEELAWLREVYDRMFAERIEAVPGGHFDVLRPYDSPGEAKQLQLLMPEVRFTELRKSGFWRNGREIASQLLGVEAKALRGWGHMLPKPPRVGEPLPWHQDEAYWDPGFEYRALGCWLTLDEATTESGCMSFIPGSHRGDVRKHRHLHDDPTVHALVVDEVDLQQAVPAEVPAGGAVFHHCRILHSSRPNRSDHIRRAWATEWQLPPVQLEIPAARSWMEEGKRAWESRKPGESGS